MIKNSLAFLLAGVLALGCGDDGAGANVGSGGSSASGGATNSGGASSGGALSGGSGGQATGGLGSGGLSSGGATDSGGTSSGGAASGGNGGSGTGGADGTASAWIPSWATTLQTTEDRNLPMSSTFPNNTVRQYVWPTLSGEEIRLHVSNEKGTSPLTIQKVHVALAPGGAVSGSIDSATDTELTFEGTADVTIPAGETAWSDPLAFSLTERELLAITMQLGAMVPSEVTGHPGARNMTHIQSGDAVSQATVSGESLERWYFIEEIEVMAPADTYAIALLGDSITDGYGTHSTYERWGDFLTLEIENDPMISDQRPVLNFGMGANNLTKSGDGQDSGLIRFQRDVLGHPKIKWLVVMEGINDIKYSNVQASPIIAAYQQIIQEAHQEKIFVYGCTLTPHNEFNDIRAEVNQWIRESGEFDAVIDMEAAVRAGDNPNAWASGMGQSDNLHPTAAGYEAMAQAVDLSLFYETMP